MGERPRKSIPGTGTDPVARIDPPPTTSGLTMTTRSLHYGGARWWGSVVAVLALAAGTVAYRHLTSPERIRRQARHYLADFVTADVSVDAAEFSFFSGIALTGVAVAEPGAVSDVDDGVATRRRSAFHCENLLLKHDPIRMLFGRLAVAEVVAVNPSCTVIQDVESGRLNLDKLFRPRSGAEGARPMRLPTVRLRDASLHMLRRTGSQIKPVETLHLQLLARPDPDDCLLYRIAWIGGGAQRSRGSSVLDLRSMTFIDEQGGMPWVTLETAMITVGSRIPGAANYFDLLGLTGEVRAFHYNLSATTDPARQRRATVKLRHAAMSIPIDADERALPADQRYLQFTDVDGTIEFFTDRVWAVFTGRFHGSKVDVSVELCGQPESGGLADLGFDVMFSGIDIQLPSRDADVSPAQARFVRRWRKLRDFYRDFDPHGLASLEFSVAKDPGEDQPVQLRHGRLEAVACDAAYRFFPYRVGGIAGTVEFTDDGVHLRDLAGMHGGALIVVNGWIAEPRWHAAVKLDMTGESVALDRDLHDALGSAYRTIWDQFALAGTADVTVQMERAQGAPGHTAPWTADIESALRDAEVCFTGFPYPLRNVQGRVDVDPQGIRVRQLSGSAGSGTVVAEGHANLRDGRPTDLDLVLRAEAVPFDDPLLDALPAEARDLVRSFAPRGTFGLSGTLVLDPTTRAVNYDLTATIRNVAAAYRHIPVHIDQVTGPLRLRPGRIDVPELKGRFGSGTVTVTGSHAAGPGASETHLVVACRNLTLDDELTQRLPPHVADAVRDIDIVGGLNTTTEFDRTVENGEPTTRLRTVIELDPVAVRHAAFPLPFTNVRGRLVVAGDQVTVTHVTAEHHDARFTAKGQFTRTSERVTGTAALHAAGIGFDEELRRAVPWRWRRTWNNLRPAGTFDLGLPQIRYQRDGDEPAQWQFEGSVIVKDLTLDLGVDLSGASGRVRGHGFVNGPAPGLTLDGRIELDRLSINERWLTDVAGNIHRSGRSERTTIADLQGQIYGGTATGNIEWTRDGDKTTYAATALLHGVNLHDFLNAGRRQDRLPPLDAQGTLDGRIYLSGIAGEPESRRGGGRITVRRGHLVKMPLLAAVLNVLNFSDVDDTVFHDLSAEFFIQGRHVQIKDLMLQGRGLAMMGSGTLELPDKSLDLVLISTGPHEWEDVPVLTELLEGTSRELMEVHVRGPLNNTTIQARPFRGVGETIKTLVQPKEPTQRD
ncbi:MAG: hypothetical protein JSV19_12180 [Phycisphaerales bacterium]|nr:MAG: hypothetical protein JSV19_12180 [Phycisphaerales bacterium]